MKSTLDKIAQFAYSHRETVQHTYDMTLRALELDGCLVECGVGAGAQIAAMKWAMLGLSMKPVYAFDSFEGIPLGGPDDAEQPGIGMMKHNPNLPLSERLVSSGITVHSLEDVQENIQSLGFNLSNISFIKGWFQHTLPIWAKSVGPIALLRLDGDLYESTRVCLEHLYPLVVPGGIVIIDDYSLAGCRKACDEFGLNGEIVAGSGGVMWFKKQ